MLPTNYEQVKKTNNKTMPETIYVQKLINIRYDNVRWITMWKHLNMCK